MKPTVIAFYLPQYHPTPHNNEWWGPGFTEWTNVGKAKKLFPGHYQPKVPADLGYYDLRLPEVREQQAQLAREAGIDGFCYYHYWFEEGKEELDLPFKEVLRLGKPDFPFCLCWANQSWHSKFWNSDGSITKRLLIEQKYQGVKENEKHFYALLEAFKDHRYIRIDGKPVFMIYSPKDFVGIESFIIQWNKLAIENGLNGIFFIGYSLGIDDQYPVFKKYGFDAICSCRLGECFTKSVFRWGWRLFQIAFKIPRIYNYKKVYPYLIQDLERSHDDIFPTMVPNWDHTPRSGRSGYLYSNCSPFLFEKHAKEVIDAIADRPSNRRICFLKSWNEWGEGNYMEPDLRFGKGFIFALRRVLDLNI